MLRMAGRAPRCGEDSGGSGSVGPSGPEWSGRVTGLQLERQFYSKSWALPSGPGRPPAQLEMQLVAGGAWPGGAGKGREGVQRPLGSVVAETTKGSGQTFFICMLHQSYPWGL